MNKAIDIKSGYFWIDFVDMLQQNWVMFDDKNGFVVRVYFINHTSGLIDEIEFSSTEGHLIDGDQKSCAVTWHPF